MKIELENARGEFPVQICIAAKSGAKRLDYFEVTQAVAETLLDMFRNTDYTSVHFNHKHGVEVIRLAPGMGLSIGNAKIMPECADNSAEIARLGVYKRTKLRSVMLDNIETSEGLE